MVNVIVILPLTLSQNCLCEPSTTIQIHDSLRDHFSMHKPICHVTFTLHTASYNKIIFHWIRAVVTAWKSPAGWWETKSFFFLKKAGIWTLQQCRSNIIVQTEVEVKYRVFHGVQNSRASLNRNSTYKAQALLLIWAMHINQQPNFQKRKVTLLNL